MEGLGKSRLTCASREGRSTMKSTAEPHAFEEIKHEFRASSSASLHGASKGKLTETTFVRDVPKVIKKKKKTKRKRNKNKKKRQLSAPKAIPR